MPKVLVTENDFKVVRDECIGYVGIILRLARRSSDSVIDPYYVNQLSAVMMSRLKSMSQYAMGHEDNLLAITAYNTVYSLGNSFKERLATIRSNQRKLNYGLKCQRRDLMASFQTPGEHHDPRHPERHPPEPVEEPLRIGAGS